MNPENLPTDARTLPEGLPIFLEGGKEAVLVVHGFTGIAGELRYIAERLHGEGYTVSVPRLPGHGTRGADLLETDRWDWLRRVMDEYFDLKCRYREVHLVGLSMGALLVLITASRFAPKKIVLAAPAIINTDRLILLTPLIRLFRGVLPKRDYIFFGPPEYAAAAEEYWRYKWPAPAAELLRLQRLARKALSGVDSDILIIVSEKDDTVPLKAADIIERGVSSRRIHRITLKESGHVVLNDSEREKAADEIIRWLSSAG